MSKSTTKITPQQKVKPPKKNTSPTVVHNRLRKEKHPSDDPAYLEAQRLYYARQPDILAKKKQYRQDVKDGKRIPVPKTSESKIKSKASKKKSLTPERKAEVIKAQKRDHYKKNKKTILAYQEQHKKEKAEKEKQVRIKNAIDAFNKLNGY